MVQQIKNEANSNQNKKEKTSPKARLLSHIATKDHRQTLDPTFLPTLSSTSNWLETSNDYATGATENKVEATASLLRAIRTFR
jgi:hypothetical protein